MSEPFRDKKFFPEGSAHQNIDSSNGIKVFELAEQLTELQKANEEIRAARRAALNLMEDAILSKEALRKSEQQLARELKDTKLLQQISSRIIEKNNVDQLYEAILDSAKEIMKADCATIQLLIPGKNELYLLAQKGIHTESAKHFEYVGTDTLSSCTQALIVGERVIINDLQSHAAELSEEDAKAYRLSGIVAMQSTPLISRGGKRVGMITTHWKQVHQPLDRQLSLFDVLARQAADLIERKLSEDVIQQTLHDTQLLRELGARLLTEENIDVFYHDIVDAAIKLTNADAGTIQLYDKATRQLHLTTVIGLGKDVTDHFQTVDADSATSCGIALAKNERVFIDFDVPPSEDPDGSLKIHADAGFYSAQSTPLTTRSDQPIGMLNTHFRKHYRPTEHQLRFIDLLARQTADLIEQRQSEQALRKSEEKYRTLFDTMDEALAICRVIRDDTGKVVDLRYLAFNNAHRKHTGLDPDTLIGRYLSGVLTKADVERWIPIYARIANSRNPESFEDYVDFVDRWYMVSVYPGNDDELSIFYRDITERKRREEQQEFLLKFSDNLRAEESADGVANRALEMLIEYLRLDRSYIVSYHLDKNIALLNYQVGNETVPPLPGTFDLSQYPEAYKAILDQTLVIEDDFERQGLSEEEKQNSARLSMRAMVAATVRKGENTPLWSMAAINSKPRRWTPDEVQLVEEVAERTWTAIERAKAEEALRKSEEKYRTLFSSVEQGFCIIELLYDESGKAVDYRWLEANPNYEKHSGIKNPAGKLGSEVIPATENYWLENYDNVLKTGEGSRFENWHEPTGRWYQTYASRVGDDKSRQIAIVFDDITERKQRELSTALLSEIGKDLSLLNTAEEMMYAVGARLTGFMQLTGCVLTDVNEELGEVTAHYGFTEGVALLKQTYVLDEYVTPEFMRACKAGEAFIVNDTQTDNRLNAEGYARLGIGALVVIPFLHKGKWTNYVGVTSIDTRQWKEAEIALLWEVAERLFSRLERVRAEEALRQSEEKFRTVFETIDEGFCIIEFVDDAEGRAVDFRMVEVNKAYERASGLKDVTGKLLSEIAPGIDRYWIDFYDSVARTGMPARKEDYSTPVDRWFATNVTRIGGPESRRVAIVFEDVTERKQRELQQAFLLKLSDSLRTVSDADTIANLAVNLLANELHLDRCYIVARRQEGDLWDIGPEFRIPALPPMPPVLDQKDFPGSLRIITEETLVFNNTNELPSLTEMEKKGLQALGFGGLVMGVLRTGEKNPSWSIVGASVKPRQWTSSEIALIQEVGERVWGAMERARAEEALRKSEAKFRRLSNSGLVAVAFFDIGGPIVEANDAFLDMLGVTRDELNSDKVRWDVYTPKEWMPRTLQAIEEFKQTGYIRPYEKQFYHTSGALRWGIFAGATLEDGHTGVSLVIDITERRKAEEALRKSQLRIAKELEDTKQLQQFSNRVIQLDDEKNIYETLLDAAMKLMRSDFASFQLYAPETEVLTLIAHRNFHPRSAAFWHTVAAGSGSVCGEALRNQSRIIVTDIETEDFAKNELDIFRLSGIRAVQSTPIISRSGHLIGMLNTQWKQPRTFSDEDFYLFDVLVRQVGDLIEKKQAEEALKQRERELASVQEIGNIGGVDIDVVNNLSGERSPEYLRLHGLSADDKNETHEDWLQRLHPDDRQQAEVTLFKALNSNQSGYENEYRIIRPNDKQVRWIYAKLDITRDEAGKPLRLAGVHIDITPRKNAEEALRESEERLRTLADAVPQVIWANDAKGTANYFNERWYEYSGLDYEQSVGLGWEAIVHPDDAPASRQKWQQALAAREIFDTEYRLRRHDGVYRWFIGRNVPLKDRAGNITGWFGSATDIHDLKEAQEALSQSEERLSITMETAVDFAIINTNTEGLVEGWNSGAEKIFGFTEEEITGKPANAIFTEEDLANNIPQKEMKTAREKGRAEDERWHKRKDGSRLFASGIMRPIYNPQLTGYVKIARDMTQQKQAEELIKISEERYRIALQSAAMAAWDWNVADDLINWNDQHYFLLGLQPEGIKKDLAFFMQFVHEYDKKRVEEALRLAVTESGKFEGEFRIRRADNNEIRWMNGYGRAVAWERQQVTRMVGVMFNITERKLLEQQKDDFIGIASHELKTPVTSIKAYTEILLELLDESGDALSKDLVVKLDKQVDRFLNLIRMLLDVTKISEGQFLLNASRFELNELVKERAEELQLSTDKHHVIQFFDAPALVTADRDRIGEALTNLISNAIKYSPKGGDIIINTIQTADGIQVSVKDQGVGIPENMKDKVFERFYRVRNATVGTFPGMGLGLYITAAIIQQHKGKIWVESQPGDGSTFYFTLPTQ